MIGLTLTLMLTALNLGSVKVCNRCDHTYPQTSRLDRRHMTSIVNKVGSRSGFTMRDSTRNAILRITFKESSWNTKAKNPRSTSSSLNGFLNSTWKSTGIRKTDCPYCQIEAMIKYIKGRYGTPEKALAHHRRRGWY